MRLYISGSVHRRVLLQKVSAHCLFLIELKERLSHHARHSKGLG
jgi:hypothetical protein